MQINKPYLFIEVGQKNLIFFIVEYNEELNFKILDMLITKSEGITNNKISSIELLSKKIKKNLDLLEKKINFIFRNAVIINNLDSSKCINVSGFKKLSGSQISNEDISYILNDIKKIVLENEKEHYLIHLLNSNFTLDKTVLENLPIGLYGDFYNHHLTFFLLSKNNFKNLELALNRCHIKLERIILKNFSDSLPQMKKCESKQPLFSIKFGEEKIDVSVFNNSSFLYSERFNFGTDLIMKDVSKVCSFPNELTKKIFLEVNFGNNTVDIKNYLDKKYFKDILYRKISIDHIIDIIEARMNEIIKMVYINNINVKSFKNINQKIYITFEDNSFKDNLGSIIKNLFINKENIFLENIPDEEHIESCHSSAELVGRGWKNEAIPIIQTEKSTIAKIFSALFR